MSTTTATTTARDTRRVVIGQETSSANRDYRSRLVKCFVMERHYRHLLLSLSLHTLLCLIIYVFFSPSNLYQAYLVDVLVLLLAAFGTARKLPPLIFPSVVVKFICFLMCAGVAMLSLSETSVNMKTKEARMEFRRQRNYPEFVNVTFEDHPTVCIWIHALAVVVALDLNLGLKAFYSAFDCIKKPKPSETEEEKPPSYSTCVKNAALPPTYEEAIHARLSLAAAQGNQNVHIV